MAGWAQAVPLHMSKLATTPPIARPLTKVRRDGRVSRERWEVLFCELISRTEPLKRFFRMPVGERRTRWKEGGAMP